MMSKWLLWFECIAIFVVIPLSLWLRLVNTPLILIPVFIVCIPATVWLARKYGFSRASFWSGDPQAERKQLKRIIKRFLYNAILLLAIVAMWYPEHLLDLPRKTPLFWLLLMVIYSLFSVYPQELLYRAFFLHRYQPLFNKQHHLLLLNAILFGWMHVVFHNVLAVVFTLVAGWLFADTYHKTKSLRLTCLEHALYGNLIFTLGYGEAFLFGPWLQYIYNI